MEIFLIILRASIYASCKWSFIEIMVVRRVVCRGYDVFLFLYISIQFLSLIDRYRFIALS